VTVFRAHGATNVSFALILLSKTFASSTIGPWYPGNSYVDWVAADGYNFDGCGVGSAKWFTFSTLFSNLNNFAVLHGKPAMIAEWASTEDSLMTGRKAAWISAAATTMMSWPHIKAALYFDGVGLHPGCTWPLPSSISALDAFALLGSQAWFNP
jgi:hypothetical protein